MLKRKSNRVLDMDFSPKPTKYRMPLFGFIPNFPLSDLPQDSSKLRSLFTLTGTIIERQNHDLLIYTA